ncbi:MAG TPA: transporter substrate-binding domain-containing protein [Burkholderiaceae bacterium]|nr:transporter substrate-binding domain-containing protein [Burkholderiaceae bacterium]
MRDPITRRRFGMCWSLMPLLAMSACAAGPALPAGAAALLAPTGRLRACIDLGNPILASRDASGTVAGVSVDLATALAQQLGLPLELIVVEAAAQSVEAVKTGAADIGSSRSTRTAAATASRSRRRT